MLEALLDFFVEDVVVFLVFVFEDEEVFACAGRGLFFLATLGDSGRVSFPERNHTPK